jgi:hypothetical protein
LANGVVDSDLKDGLVEVDPEAGGVGSPEGEEALLFRYF